MDRRYLSAQRPRRAESLAFPTDQLHAWTQEVDLLAPRQVSWASDQSVPAWLDLTRELTETWVHHQQIRAATGRHTSTSRLPTVLRTFVWELPYQYRTPAAPGTAVVVDLDTGGLWRLAAGHANRWILEEGAAGQRAAYVAFTAAAAWRSFTGASVPQDGVRCTGPRDLTAPGADRPWNHHLTRPVRRSTSSSSVHAK